MFRTKSLVILVLGWVAVGLFSPAAHAQVLLDPATQPKFVNPVPNPLDPSFLWTEASTDHYEIGMGQTRQWLGLVDPVTGAPLMTTVWGYHNVADPDQGTTYPGRTFEVWKDRAITVQWRNNLVDADGAPLPHLLPVDTSLHWAFGLPGWSMDALDVYGVPVVPHLHGGHTESDSDGLPEYWWTPGESAVGPRFVKSLYTYDNDQLAGTLWYHDHGLGITRLNVYAGLAGFYILRDEVDTGDPDNPLGLPAFPYEIPLVIQDRLFTADGELFYPTVPMEIEPGFPTPPDPSALPEFFGNIMLVNGVAWPKLDVEPRKYRLRLLNGSDSRFYDLFLSSGQMFQIIGTDDALLASPVAVQRFDLGPGERYDVIVDFAGYEGQQIVLKNNARSPFPKGATVDPNADGQIMAFQVGTTVTTPDKPLPASLAPPITPAAMLAEVARTRSLALFEGIDEYGRLKPMLGVARPTTDIEGNVVNGSLSWDEHHYPITEFPMLDDVEIWEVYNATADAHPIHLHLVSFQILSRQKYRADVLPKDMVSHNGQANIGFELQNIRDLGQAKSPLAHEKGWKDTAIMYPGEVTRIIARFDRPGRYVWHCHILSHEDHEMMRPYEVLAPVAEGMTLEPPAQEAVRIDRSLALDVHPNPFNPRTTLHYRLPTAGDVSLAVYNVRGERVKTLVAESQAAGQYSVVWNGDDDRGAAVATGAYFAHLRTADRQQVQRMLLVK